MQRRVRIVDRSHSLCCLGLTDRIVRPPIGVPRSCEFPVLLFQLSRARARSQSNRRVRTCHRIDRHRLSVA